MHGRRVLTCFLFGSRYRCTYVCGARRDLPHSKRERGAIFLVKSRGGSTCNGLHLSRQSRHSPPLSPLGTFSPRLDSRPGLACRLARLSAPPIAESFVLDSSLSHPRRPRPVMHSFLAFDLVCYSPRHVQRRPATASLRRPGAPRPRLVSGSSSCLCVLATEPAAPLR